MNQQDPYLTGRPVPPHLVWLWAVAMIVGFVVGVVVGVAFALGVAR